MEPRFRKSSYSNLSCVEVALLDTGHVAVRDSKNTTQPPHLFTAGEWDAFLAGVRDGEFDRTTLGSDAAG